MAGNNGSMFGMTARRGMHCAIYTRRSTEEGLEQEFNTLDAQRDSAEAYIRSQREDGWVALPDRYDDGGYTRPCRILCSPASRSGGSFLHRINNLIPNFHRPHGTLIPP